MRALTAWAAARLPIDLQRPLGGGQAVVDLSAPDQARQHLAERHQRPGLRIVGIDLGGALAQPHDRLVAPDVALVAGGVVLPRHQVEVVGIEVGRAALLDRLLLLGQQLELQRLDDRFRDLVLQREDVAQVAVVALGPDVVAGGAIDQLRGDAHAAARLAHAALEHVLHLELARHLRHVDELALVHERAVARDDGQRRDLAQVGDDVLGDAVAEVLLLGIAAHVDERQHADADPCGSRRGAGAGACRAGAAVSRNHRAQRPQQRLERRALGVVAPAVHVGRVDRTHVHRQPGAVEACRHQRAKVGRFACFTADPARRHRRRRPDHEHSLGGLQLFLDLVVELLARVDLRVPPDRPALRLDRRDQRRDASLVAAGIRNEDVSHSPCTCSRNTPGPRCAVA